MDHLVAEGDTVQHLVEEAHRHSEQLGLPLVELFHLRQQLDGTPVVGKMLVEVMVVVVWW
jgi:hypothetical protein